MNCRNSVMVVGCGMVMIAATLSWSGETVSTDNMSKKFDAGSVELALIQCHSS